MGTMARVRDRTAIRTVISRHPATFESLYQSFGDIIVVDIIWSLLDSGTFESKTKAKLAFPELYQPSPARNLQHDVSEQEAARSEAKALAEASRSNMDMPERDQGGSWNGIAGDNPVKDTPTYKPSDPPSLFPAYLSYSSQHKLLNSVQHLLEDCCYEWATSWTPDLLRDKRWSCSEAVELGVWSTVLPRLFGSISTAATTCESGVALAEVLKATHQLRHAAVHRLPTSVKGIERMLQNALNLATTLQDQEYMVKLDSISMDFQNTMQDMELHKNDLESQLDAELRDIQDQRQALDRKEKEAKLNMLQQDQENTATISLMFEKSIRKLTTTDQHDASDAENAGAGNVDPEVSTSDAVAVDTIFNPETENDETAVADADADTDEHSGASTRRDTEASITDPSGTAEQPAENESTALPSELSPDGSDLPTQFIDQSPTFGPST